MLVRRRTFLASSLAPLAAAFQTEPPRLERKQCFFGIHLDLHPQKDDTALGRDVSEEMIEDFLARVKPDFVQYDCKGHAGYLGYKSSVGTPAPGIVKDSLEIWRRVTARRGVALFIHFSGVWDGVAVHQHPEWARVGPDGKPDPNITSTFGPYVNELMIPELKEASSRYDLDGVWVDGECWAVAPDYSEAAAAAFRERTGITALPRSKNDPGWLEFLELNRAQFRRYVRHYVDELHRARPGFQIASNWLYSTFVPERPELPVDYISGDYLGSGAISTARLEARYMAQTGRPWDLMAWGFTTTPGDAGIIFKPAVQLTQESAVVLAQGGGFQIYYEPTRAGMIDKRNTGVMARVASFCRARQKLSHKSETVPQIGVLLSTRSLYRTSERLFGSWGSAIDPGRGMLDALVESRFPVDVIPEWKLDEAAAVYSLIVVPDWPDTGEAVKKTLTVYVAGGGRLLVIGAANAGLFADLLGARLAGSPARVSAFIPGDEVFAHAGGLWQALDPLPGTDVAALRFPTYGSERDGQPAAIVAKRGKGVVAAIPGPAGTIFAASHDAALRQVIRGVVRRIFEPVLSVEAPHTVEAVLRRKDGAVLVHLLNSTAMQVAADYATADFIPFVENIRVTLRLPAKPRRVTLEPEGRPLAGEWKNGAWTGEVPRLEVHSIVRFES